MLEYSVVSYPSRGPYGKPDYRGNTSGYLIKDIIQAFKPRHVLDPMSGSGTTGDVCTELGVPALLYDLHRGDDILSPVTKQKMLAEVTALTGKPALHSDGGVDMIFFHPPYWNMITYSDNPRDFSAGSYAIYLRRMESALTHLAQLLSPEGRIFLLLGDLRRDGRSYFMTDDVTAMGAVVKSRLTKEGRLIKVQHNTSSSGVVDIPGGYKLAHEYVTILKRGW